MKGKGSLVVKGDNLNLLDMIQAPAFMEGALLGPPGVP